MPHSLGVGHGRTLSRRVLLVVGLSVSIVLVVGGLILLLLLQGAVPNEKPIVISLMLGRVRERRAYERALTVALVIYVAGRRFSLLSLSPRMNDARPAADFMVLVICFPTSLPGSVLLPKRPVLELIAETHAMFSIRAAASSAVAKARGRTKVCGPPRSDSVPPTIFENFLAGSCQNHFDIYGSINTQHGAVHGAFVRR